MDQTDINIYQIYYKDHQKQHMFLDAIPLFNSDISLYFENNVILNLYKQGKIVGEYFGALSWNARLKNKLENTSLHEFICGNYDIYSLTYDNHDVIGYAIKCHPDFLDIFTELMKYLNIDENIRPRIGLYQNGIITNPSIYKDFIENYLIPSIEFLDNCSGPIKEKLYSDAKYSGGNIEVLKDYFGFDHYPYHPFVLERLWSVYYHINRSKTSLRFLATKIHPLSYRPIKVYTKGKMHKFNL